MKCATGQQEEKKKGTGTNKIELKIDLKSCTGF